MLYIVLNSKWSCTRLVVARFEMRFQNKFRAYRFFPHQEKKINKYDPFSPDIALSGATNRVQESNRQQRSSAT